MTAAATAQRAARPNPFDTLADELPPVIDGTVLLADGTFPGESRDPRDEGAVLPGHYVFDQDVWLRVEEAWPAADGTAVVCGRFPFVTLNVPAGGRVAVWPLASVALHVYGGGAL